MGLFGWFRWCSTGSFDPQEQNRETKRNKLSLPLTDGSEPSDTIPSAGTPVTPSSAFIIDDGQTVGIKNSIRKYAVNQPIQLNYVPYEERLALALEKEAKARVRAKAQKIQH